MKVKNIVPLFLFIVFMLLMSIFLLQDYIWIIIPSFIIFYPMPYLSGLRETVKNRDVVLKIKKKSPYIIPILFFSLPTIVINIIFLITDLTALIFFVLIYLISLVCYFSGIYILIRNLKEKIELGRIVVSGDKDESKKKLLLINPVNKEIGGLTINPSSTFPPLGLGIIAALTPKTFNIKLVDENFYEI